MAEIKNIQDEIWVPIAGFSKYEISNHGRVRSHTRKGRILKLQPSSDLYLRAEMVNDEGEWKNVSVSRMVAIAFIPNPNKLPQVNHINEKVQDNNVANLEWCDGKYNSNYGTRGRRIGEKLSIPIEQYDTEGNLIAKYRSSVDAYNQTGCDSSSIVKCCKGKLKHFKGFIWKYGRS